jgi:hypothetical protein
MTLKEMTDMFRRLAFDEVADYYWSDQKVTMFLNQSNMEAARRTRWLVDSSTPDVCQIAVVAGQGEYILHPAIISMRRLRLNGQSLTPKDVRDLDLRGDWESDQGDPCHFVVGLGSTTLHLYPQPVSDGVLKLTVSREPLDTMTMVMDESELPARCHDAIVYGALALAYAVPDPDSESPQRSAKYQSMFDQEFGPAELGKLSNEVWMRENRAYLPSQHWG